MTLNELPFATNKFELCRDILQPAVTPGNVQQTQVRIISQPTAAATGQVQQQPAAPQQPQPLVQQTAQQKKGLSLTVSKSFRSADVWQTKIFKTRLHYSRMRIVRLLTLSQHALHKGGGVPGGWCLADPPREQNDIQV